MNWFENAVFYHIYPIGYFGCPRQNDFTSEPTHKILRVIDDIPHIKELGCNAVYFGPVFESSAHGYDTTDYTKIDRRLGTNEDFKKACSTMSGATSGLSGTSARTSSAALRKTGSMCAKATTATTTASGTKAGRVITSW